MPRISYFYGISIQMFFDDHPPPHIHAKYNEFRARFDIRTGEVLSGRLPPQATRLVQDWIAKRDAELASNWTRMENGLDMVYIEGLE